jgi:hypothetical protein
VQAATDVVENNFHRDGEAAVALQNKCVAITPRISIHWPMSTPPPTVPPRQSLARLKRSRRQSAARDLPPCARRFSTKIGAANAGDLLYGAAAVAEFLFSDRKYRRRVYNLVEGNGLPVFRIGSTSARARASSSNGLPSRSAAVFNLRTTRAPIRGITKEKGPSASRCSRRNNTPMLQYPISPFEEPRLDVR